MTAQIQLVAYARTIAVYAGYSVLVNGLQPVEDYEVDGAQKPGLRSKFAHEREEFAEAAPGNKDEQHEIHLIAEALGSPA